MTKKQNLTTFCLLLTLASCTSISTHRDPSSLVESKNWEELRDLKQRKVELSALSVHFQKKKNEDQLKKIKNEQKNINEKITEIESSLTTLESGSKYIQNGSTDWRGEKERLDLSDLRLYELNKNVQFSVSTYEAHETVVKLTQKFFTTLGYKHTDDVHRGGASKPVMKFTMKCDAPVEVKYGFVTKKVKSNTVYKFQLGDKKNI